MISRNNYRKIIIKDFVKTNDFSKHIQINRNIIRNNISSIELSPREKELELKMIQRYKKSLDSKNIINKLRLTNNNQFKLININNNTLNKTPEKDEKNKIKYIKSNYSADQDKLINNNKLQKNVDNTSKKINLSNIYRLPIILKNEFKTVKLNSIKKPKKIDTKREEIIKDDIKPNSPNDLIQNKKIYEIKNTINKDLNKNININIIDFNQIYVKKELKPIKIYKHITDNLSKSERQKNYQKMKLHNYMKDRFYADTELKMNKKLKNTVFNHDQSLKDKIIEMNQIEDFWGGIVDYCNPYFAIKKFQYLTKRLNKNRKSYKNNIENLINKENYSSWSKKISKSEVKSMRLFTINSYLDYKYKKKLEEKKEFLEKNNDSLQYYML